MIATPLPLPLPIINPTARLQIKYVSRLPPLDLTPLSPLASKLRHRSPTLSNLSATVIENSSSSTSTSTSKSQSQSQHQLDSWTISTTLTNTNAPIAVPNNSTDTNIDNTASERHTITITFWPMFEPDFPHPVTSATTDPITPGNSTTLNFTVPFRDLAVLDRRIGGSSGSGNSNTKGKKVLEEGMYMFGIRSEKVGGTGKKGGMVVGNGDVSEIIKQVCVVGRREWES